MPCQDRLQFLERRVVRTNGDVGAPPTRVDIALSCGLVHILCLQPGQEWGNRMVRLRQVVDRDQEGARYELLTNARGECLIEALPVGSWTIEPMHGGTFEPGTLIVGAGPNSATVQWRP
ncbi:MAG: hypothetical protein ABIP94_20730 [Planctomycetota bacterium]